MRRRIYELIQNTEDRDLKPLSLLVLYVQGGCKCTRQQRSLSPIPYPSHTHSTHSSQRQRTS